MKTRIYEDRSNCVTEAFPQYTEKFTDVQLEHMWTARELNIEDDKHSIITEMSEAERYGVINTLKLFTKYEIAIGEEYWSNRFLKIVKGPEFTAMGLTFAAVELAVHKQFYQKINQAFNLDTEEFYEDFSHDPILKHRMQFIGEMVDHPNDLVSLGAFSLIEGAILYSSFAYLRHFQANGKSKIKKIVAGNALSALDEGLHSTAGAAVFRQLSQECLEDGVYEQRYGAKADVEKAMYSVADSILEHECRIADRIFDKGAIEGITADDLKQFVRHRLNECLTALGLESRYDAGENKIAGWFYKSISGFTMIDFFNASGSQYVRSWSDHDFEFEAEKTPYN